MQRSQKNPFWSDTCTELPVIIDRLKYGCATQQFGIHCSIYSSAEMSGSKAEEKLRPNINLAETSFGLCVGIKVVMLYLSGMS
jgi:hypothetical protein